MRKWDLGDWCGVLLAIVAGLLYGLDNASAERLSFRVFLLVVVPFSLRALTWFFKWAEISQRISDSKLGKWVHRWFSRRRTECLWALGLIAAFLLVRNIWTMLTQLPDEAFQGAIFRIIFFHVPAAFTCFLCFFMALLSGITYLKTENLKWDAFSVSVTEVGLAFGAANLVTGMIWARIIWGIWWTWDWRLTSMLICWLLYAGYLVLRRAIEEPTERARLSAVMSILSFTVVPFVFFSIKWFRTQHPQPVLYGQGKMDANYRSMLFGNWVPLLLFAIILIAVRMQQENRQRELDALRREIHAF